jgi:hypothetical protein
MVKQSSKPQTSKPRQSSKSQAPKPRPTQQQGKQQQQDDQNTRLIKRNQKTVNPILPRSPSIINTPRGYSPVGNFTDILRTLLGRRGSGSNR